MDLNKAAVVAVVLVAGLMRGTTGFGGAILMAPPLSFLIGPVPAVATALLLETAAAVVMFPDAWPRINKPVLLYLIVPACITIPIGGYLLITLDPFIARKFIAAVVVVFSLGRRGRPPRSRSAASSAYFWVPPASERRPLFFIYCRAPIHKR